MDDNMILSVNSPQEFVGGPYAVVYKDADGPWAIVALDWYENPTLGIRYFGEQDSGHPNARGKPVWFIIPDALHRGILATLPLDVLARHNMLKFLDGTFSGKELRERSRNGTVMHEYPYLTLVEALVEASPDDADSIIDHIAARFQGNKLDAALKMAIFHERFKKNNPP